MSYPGSQQHQALIGKVAAELAAKGRVILCAERLPRILAIKDGQVWAVTPRHLRRAGKSAGKGKWLHSKSIAATSRRYPRLDGVHVFTVRGADDASRAADEKVAALQDFGWRVLKIGNRCPDALLLEPDGKLIAVEALLVRPDGSRNWTRRAKEQSYAVFDGVHIVTERREMRTTEA